MLRVPQPIPRSERATSPPITMLHYIHVRSTASTNSYLSRLAAQLPGDTVICTHHQTAGRGQRGNSWEAEPGKNLTFSLLLKHPDVLPREQFLISEAVSLAITQAVAELGVEATVKWPNDIYCGDRKLCGILIEHVLDPGGIAHTVVGVGLNVNQTTFVSDAPNPVSLAQLTGGELDVEALLRQVCEGIVALCHFGSDSDRQALHERYLKHLYRNDGREHPFALPDGTPLRATIAGVERDGMLVLRHSSDNSLHRYAFKEVKHIINNITL